MGGARKKKGGEEGGAEEHQHRQHRGENAVFLPYGVRESALLVTGVFVSAYHDPSIVLPALGRPQSPCSGSNNISFIQPFFHNLHEGKEREKKTEAMRCTEGKRGEKKKRKKTPEISRYAQI